MWFITYLTGDYEIHLRSCSGGSARAHNSLYSFIQSHLIVHSFCMACRSYASLFCVVRVSVSPLPHPFPPLLSIHLLLKLNRWKILKINNLAAATATVVVCVLHVEAAASNETGFFFFLQHFFSIFNFTSNRVYFLHSIFFFQHGFCAPHLQRINVLMKYGCVFMFFIFSHLFLLLPVKSNYPLWRDQKCNCVVFRWSKINTICEQSQSISHLCCVYAGKICENCGHECVNAEYVAGLSLNVQFALSTREPYD